MLATVKPGLQGVQMIAGGGHTSTTTIDPLTLEAGAPQKSLRYDPKVTC